MRRGRRRIAQVPAWRTMTTRLATSEKAPIVLTVDEGYGGQPQKRTDADVRSRHRPRSRRTKRFESLSAGRRARSWLRFAHTGEFYGLTGQTIAGIVSAGGAVLVYTGHRARVSAAAGVDRRRRAPRADVEAPARRLIVRPRHFIHA